MSRKHDVRPAANSSGHHNRAYCFTHDCVGMDTFSTLQQAYAMFECDGGSNARFIVEQDGISLMTDLTGLKYRIHSLIESRNYGWDVEEMRFWRWLGDGKSERLEITCKQPGAFGDDDYAYPVHTATGPSGTEHVRVTVKIDGRA